jgi:hypothetical protein
LESYRQIVQRQPAWDRSCGLSSQVEGLAEITNIGMTRPGRFGTAGFPLAGWRQFAIAETPKDDEGMLGQRKQVR